MQIMRKLYFQIRKFQLFRVFKKMWKLNVIFLFTQPLQADSTEGLRDPDKFVIIRHPIYRLVSAYRSKFESRQVMHPIKDENCQGNIWFTFKGMVLFTIRQ